MHLSAKVLESSKDSLFVWNSISTFQHVGWTFSVLLCVLDKFFLFEKCFLCFVALLFVCYFVWLSQPLGWFCLCNFDFVEWKYLLFSLHFDCNVLFFFVLRYVYLVCFLFYFNLKTLCLQSRMLNSYKWLKMKKVKMWYASCCFSFYFPCVFVFFSIG